MQLSVTASPLNGTSYADQAIKYWRRRFFYKIPIINEILVSLGM